MNISLFDWKTLSTRLNRSSFRRQFILKDEEQRYFEQKGIETIRRHAVEFIKTRLAQELPPNDGKQTPMRGHPVFIAQHATATCCRKCLQKWHGIAQGKRLTEKEVEYLADVIVWWLEAQMSRRARHNEQARRPVQLELFEVGN